MNRDRLKKLQERARQLGDDLHYVMEHIEEQFAWQREELEKWAAQMNDLLMCLVNLERLLEMNGEFGDRDDDA